MVVGTHAASIAQSPELLAGAARAAGHVFRPGERVRVRVEREAVLVVAEPTVAETFLTACRRAAARLAEATDVALGGPVHLDLTAPLGEKAVGHFAFVPLDDAFFRAALQERAARTRGDHAAAAEARGLMRLALGDPEGARVHLTEAARLHPDDAELHLALGTLLNDLGDHGAATEVLRVAARLDPDSAAVNNNLGVAWQGLGRVDEALLCFEKAAAEKPRDALVQVNLGRVHFDAGRVRRAERYFRRALDRAPRSVPALTGLVLVAVRDGDLETARQRLAEAMGVDPTDEALLRLHRALHPDELLHSLARVDGVGIREDPGALLGDRHRVLEVGRELPVGGDHRPPVLEDLGLVGAGVDHRLDGDDQPGLEAKRLLPVGAAVVGDLGPLVHRPADAVAHVVADDAVARRRRHVLHRPGDVAQAAPATQAASPASSDRLVTAISSSAASLTLPMARVRAESPT